MTQDLFVCLFGFLTSSSTTRLYRGRAPRQERLTILRAATHETELGDHDFCLSRSHYTDTDPTCRERAATAGIEPGTSSPGVARSTAELPRPPDTRQRVRQPEINNKFKQIIIDTYRDEYAIVAEGEDLIVKYCIREKAITNLCAKEEEPEN